MHPVEPAARVLQLDILRGIALFGVLMVNLLTIFRVSLFSHILQTDVPADDVTGRFISSVSAAVLEFKAFALFSLLFGVGVAMQAERAASRGRHAVVGLLLRRFAVLLAIGLTHFFLVWNGDILSLYAVCGLLMIPLLHLPAPGLLIVGTALIVVPHFVPLPVHLLPEEAFQNQARLATSVYGDGTFLEILRFRWQENINFLIPLLALTLPKTLGTMLVGAAAWKGGWLPEPPRRKLLLILAAAGTTGVAGAILHIDLAAHVPLALAYAAAVLLWMRQAPYFAAAGKLALTNYLAQSIVFSIAFYGFGFGLFGRVALLPAAFAGVAVYAAQLCFSRWWLEHFYFGPVEWLWRSATYGELQPMRRIQEQGRSASALE